MTKVTKVMDNKEFAKEFEKRIREFGVCIIRLSGYQGIRGFVTL